MNDNDDRRSEQHLTDIQETRRAATEARRALRRELTRGDVSPRTKADYGARLGDYQDMLLPYKDEAALQSEWRERLPIPQFERLLATTVAKTQTGNAATGRGETMRLPKVVEIDAELLIQHGQELDKIFKELGFAASAETQVRVWGFEEPDDGGEEVAE